MKHDVDEKLHGLTVSIERMKLQIEDQQEAIQSWICQYDHACSQFDFLKDALFRIWGHDSTDPDTPQKIASDTLKKVGGLS